ncbi:PREDICTED: LIM domain-binding protein 3 isoform X3 [Rhagoletis zephyria]|uniref:LIM domain-binding protein 3 isoform X3 n=1 Tax=Rhagoletis zephyria TaxID=28612 RepID=UPI000811A96D|nr:PREDICTED: LIM domain-binding protein 3 isoform X3 [Rhagoletis zephyria]
MSPKLHEFTVVLQRDGPNTPWGIRLVGGNDLDTPLIITRVQVGSPAYGEVLRGDIIAKVRDYDARDLNHADAETLFRNAGNEIKIVVHRDSKIAYTQGLGAEPYGTGLGSSPVNSNSPDLSNANVPHRGPSPFLPGPGHYERALQLPVDSLPQTVFPKLNASGGYVAPRDSGCFSPMPTRDHQQDVAEEQAAIVNQPYRTTPLVLPGAKVKKDAPTTESYLRYHPNPAVRAHPGHDFHDSVMKQRVADTMLHKVVGQDADTGRVFHKQFNSPIGLYSDSNIENTIRQTVPASTESPRIRSSPLHRPMPTKLDRYKKTLHFDPSKSETYRAIQEEGGYGNGYAPQEVTVPVQPKVFQPNRLVPGKKPSSAAPVSYPTYNVVNTQDDTIRQSSSFNRLMYSVLGASEY